MKKLLSCLLVSALLVGCSSVLSACNSNGENGAESTVQTTAACAHKDADDNGKCDLCATDFEDGVETKEIPVVDCTITVTLDNGDSLAGVAFVAKNENEEYSLKSDDKGVISAALKVGKYALSFDYETLPAGCVPETGMLEVAEGKGAISIEIRDNNPNGTLEKPYFITEDQTAVSIEAGAELHYIYRGAAMRYLQIENADISITYKGTTYDAVDGIVSILITPQVGEMTAFSVKNKSNAKIDTTLALVSPAGSMDNPIQMNENSVIVSVAAEEVVYYSFTADKNGVLVVTSQSALNNISLINTATNAVSALTEGSAGEYMMVSAGDVIKIAVASTDSKKAAEIDLTVQCYLGTVEEPVPVIKQKIDISFGASASIAFAAEIGKTVILADETVSLTVGAQTYTPTKTQPVSVVLAGDGTTVTFTLANLQETVNGVAFDVK